MTLPCGCCEGTEALTPLDEANRPGLPALSYRAGTHATFLETMKARLSGAESPALAGLHTRAAGDPAIALLDAWATVGDVLTFYQERIANEGYLRTATLRRSVLELARLVGYAPRPGVSASVFLAYALDGSTPVQIPAGSRAQSVPEPGQLPQTFETSAALEARPSWNNLQVRLTRPPRITLDKAPALDTIYLAGTATRLATGAPLLFVFGDQFVLRRVQAVEAQPDLDPTKGRTKVTLQATGQAGAMATVLAQAIQTLARRIGKGAFRGVSLTRARFLLATLQTMRKSVLLGTSQIDQILSPGIAQQIKVQGISSDRLISPIYNAVVRDLRKASAAPPPLPVSQVTPVTLGGLLGADGLGKLPSIPPPSSSLLQRDVGQLFSTHSDNIFQLLQTFTPGVEDTLYTAWGNADVNPTSTDLTGVYTMRVTAPLFGYNAPKQPQYEPQTDSNGAANPNAGQIKPPSEWIDWDDSSDFANDSTSELSLDNAYDGIVAGNDSYVAVVRDDDTDVGTQVFPIQAVTTHPRSAYNISGKTTILTLPSPWREGRTVVGHVVAAVAGATSTGDSFQVIRDTIVYAQSELLPLAEEPIDPEPDNPDANPDADVAGTAVELDGLYDGLTSGRWAIVSGQRTDIPGTSGVMASEVVMLSGISQGFNSLLPGDKAHTTLQLANKLAYSYKRGSVTIYGNVVKATHGETRKEALGGGDGSQELQSFTLHQSPLTYLPAPTPSGISSTLVVRVNDVEWHERPTLADAGPRDRVYVTQTDDDAKTTVIFGTGERGARLPSGQENVRAVYRSGIGAIGNVAAGKISIPLDKPLGVRDVTNPVRASGGADREDRDSARVSAPLPTMALDRLVSVRDYADFARTFAGIGKASAVRLSDGQRQRVYVTIAGADDIPIDETSDLFINLRQALHDNGDPYEPLTLALRDVLLVVISAFVHVLPDYTFDAVAAAIRAAVLDAFGFARRDLAQPMYLSEVIGVMQGVAGVDYLDIETFDAVDSASNPTDLQQAARNLGRNTVISALPARLDRTNGLMPAQIAYLTPDVADTLILKELTT